jgi:hypothetical protein
MISKMKSKRFSKQKGVCGQNEVRDLFKDILGIPDSEISTAVMGESGSDIKFYGPSRERYAYDVEVKRTESTSPWAWISSFRIFFRRNRSDWHVIIPAKEYLEIEKKINYLTKQIADLSNQSK